MSWQTPGNDCSLPGKTLLHQHVAIKKNPALWPALYGCWALLAIGLSLSLAGLSPESLTRLLVIAFLLGQLGLRAPLLAAFARFRPAIRFVVLGTALAAVVEGLHMISAPVFLGLRIDRHTPVAQGLVNYGIDLLFTVPAYLVIFTVIWKYLKRYHFPLWPYVLLVGLAQTLGDGGLFFFLKAPAMLLFLPYPMTNYHAINVLPFLAVRADLPDRRPAAMYAYLIIPSLIGTYLVCGAIIKLIGRAFGFV